MPMQMKAKSPKASICHETPVFAKSACSTPDESCVEVGEGVGVGVGEGEHGSVANIAVIEAGVFRLQLIHLYVPPQPW